MEAGVGGGEAVELVVWVVGDGSKGTRAVEWRRGQALATVGLGAPDLEVDWSIAGGSGPGQDRPRVVGDRDIGEVLGGLGGEEVGEEEGGEEEFHVY